ncbi:MAG TPA: hypothetical protein VM347_22725 [Nonomuraea sp.]|nr:hypothetical protein [Nonomuraea sp.]
MGTAAARCQAASDPRLRRLADTGIGGRGAGPPDVALLRGDHDRAYEGYWSRIARDPDDIEAWAGLALSRHAVDFRGMDAPIWAAPEVLFALHRELHRSIRAPGSSRGTRCAGHGPA